jgi:hypothetical protein
VHPAIAVVLISSIALASSAHAQQLSPEEIEQAILAGASGKQRQLLTTCQAVIGFREMFKSERVGLQFSGSYEVTLSRTTGQIALLAAAAKRFYKPFTVSQVPADLKTADAIMTAEPSPPELSSTTPGSVSVAAPIELLVIKAWPNRTLVIKPTAFSVDPVEWPNVAGQTVRANRARARFRLGEIVELPPGDLEIGVVTPAGERTCIVPGRDRRRVFGR